jgi:hypothetical protein
MSRDQTIAAVDAYGAAVAEWAAREYAAGGRGATPVDECRAKKSVLLALIAGDAARTTALEAVVAAARLEVSRADSRGCRELRQALTALDRFAADAEGAVDVGR